jgi:hypothetical protein
MVNLSLDRTQGFLYPFCDIFTQERFMPSFDINDPLIATLLAAIPGILTALATDWLARAREAARLRRANQNARTLVVREVQGNRAALQSFWNEINGLDKENVESVAQHLGNMALNGLLSIPLPRWTDARWERVIPEAPLAFNQAELAALDQFYRDLNLISDVFTKMITFTPQQMELYNRERFWYLRYGESYAPNYTDLKKIVERALAVRVS